MSNPWVKRLLPVVIIVVAVLLGRGLMFFQSAPVKKPKVQPRPYVEVVVIERSPQQIYVSSQGTVAAKRKIEWASKVSGRVIWVASEFVEGARVEKGTALLKLDSTDYRVAVAEAEASLADANLAMTEEKNELKRGTTYRSTNQQDALASLRKPKLYQVEAKVRAAEANLLKAKEDLAATEIKAPFDGVIDHKQVDLGQYVSSATTLFNFFSTDIAEIRLPLTSADVSYIRAANEGNSSYPSVELSADFGRDTARWSGRLVRLENRVDADTRTFFVVAEVDQPYNLERYPTALTVGLFVNAVIEGVLIDDGVRIPRAALHDGRYVYLLKDEKLTRREVDVLRRENDSVVVAGGLNNGDRLVMTKLDLMIEGMAVTILNQEEGL